VEILRTRASKSFEGNEFWETFLYNMRKNHGRMADIYNTVGRQAVFQVGGLVLVRLRPMSSKLRHRSAKLDYKW
jgi:hypothetical protein